MFNDQFVRVLRTIVSPSTVGDHCFYTIYYLPVEKRLIQDIHIMMRRMDGKAPIFATVPTLVGEADKSVYLSTKFEEAPEAVGATLGKGEDADEVVLTGLLTGTGPKAPVRPGDKATVDDVPTKVVLHFRRRI
jgi:hypothetical protein